VRRSRLIAIAPLGVMLALLLSSPASARELPVLPVATVSSVAVGAAEDDEVVLPSRVANAITRAGNLLDTAGTSIDTGDAAKAVASLQALQRAIARADKAARKQMTAPADPNAEEGATPGPDSVIAVLTLDQTVITTLADLFDGQSGQAVDAASQALFATENTRSKLLTSVVKLPAEGAGADYADGMADTLTGYDDEVANINEALSSDALSAPGSSTLRSALAQSKKAQSTVNAAYGGGE
jgi:hypothetical protein